MIKVSNSSKIVLDKLWNLAKQNNDYYKLNKDPTYMPLTIEIIEERQISICHYGEQNGDLMRDPEMVFWKDDVGEYYPFYYRNDYVGFEQFIGEIVEGKLVVENINEQESQVEFVDIWMKNIKYQQEI